MPRTRTTSPAMPPSTTSSAVTRRLTAALLALPLGLVAPGPAAAAPAATHESGARLDGMSVVVGEIEGFPGNLHHVFLLAEETRDARRSSGWVESWACPADPRTDPVCDFTGYADLVGSDLAVTVATDLQTGSLTGAVRRVAGWDCDEATGSCSPVPGGPALEVAVSWTGDGSAPHTTTTTDRVHVPGQGGQERYRTTVSDVPASSIDGTLGGGEVLDGQGVISTFRHHAVRTP